MSVVNGRDKKKKKKKEKLFTPPSQAREGFPFVAFLQWGPQYQLAHAKDPPLPPTISRPYWSTGNWQQRQHLIILILTN